MKVSGHPPVSMGVPNDTPVSMGEPNDTGAIGVACLLVDVVLLCVAQSWIIKRH